MPGCGQEYDTGAWGYSDLLFHGALLGAVCSGAARVRKARYLQLAVDPRVGTELRKTYSSLAGALPRELEYAQYDSSLFKQRDINTIFFAPLEYMGWCLASYAKPAKFALHRSSH